MNQIEIKRKRRKKRRRQGRRNRRKKTRGKMGNNTSSITIYWLGLDVPRLTPACITLNTYQCGQNDYKFNQHWRRRGRRRGRAEGRVGLRRKGEERDQ